MTNLIQIDDGNGNSLQFDDDLHHFGTDVFYNGRVIPSARFWNLLLNAYKAEGVPSKKELFIEARRAAVYEMPLTKFWVITTTPAPDDIMLADGIFERVAPMRGRPVLDSVGGRIAFFEKGIEDTEENVEYVLDKIEELTDFEVAGLQKRRLFFVPKGTMTRLMNGMTEADKADFVLRFPTGAKRPGGEGFVLDLADLPVRPAHEMDGLMAVTSQVGGLYQGTWLLLSGQVVKGLIRPPAEGEAEWVTSTGNDKRALTCFEGRFHPLAQPGEMRFILDSQALYFTWAHPEHLLGIFPEMTAKGRLTEEAQRKLAAGVPAALLMQDLSFKEISQIPIPGARSVAIPYEGLKPGQVALCQRTYERYNKAVSAFVRERYELREGDPMYVYRAPALPDGTAVYKAEFAGVVEFPGVDEGVVLHPQDEGWARAGGDWDGDPAAVLIPIGQLREPLPREGYRIEYDQEFTTVKDAVMKQAGDPYPNMIGIITALAMCLAERGVLDDATRTQAAGLIQGAVDAIKHRIDSSSFDRSLRDLSAKVQRFKNAGYLYSGMNQLLSMEAGERHAQWTKLHDALSFGVPSPIERALIERIDRYNELFQEVRFFRMQERPELPEVMRKQSRERYTTLIEKEEESVAELRKAAQLHRDLGMDLMRMREAPENVGDMQDKQDHRRRMETRIELLCALGGEPVELAAITILSPTLAARYVSPAVFESIAADTKEGVISICDGNWRSGEYDRDEVKPIPNCTEDYNTIVGLANRVHLRVLSVSKTGRSTRVHIKPVLKARRF